MSIQAQLFQWVHKKFKLIWQREHLFLFKDKVSLLVVDRFTQPISFKHGVGLARKIGMDLCCQLKINNQLQCEYVGTTDGDALLPNNYFSSLNKLPAKYSAVCFDFQHIGNDNAITTSTLWYQASLKLYMAGLQFAGSQYAHHAIGSAIAINLQDYMAVRGFPKRAAGEDFYLLNKLRKLKPIFDNRLFDKQQADKQQAIIRIQARDSARVPFGTGPKVAAILDQFEALKGLETNSPFIGQFYDSRVFYCLKQLLASTHDSRWLNEIYNENSPISQALLTIGFSKFHQHCKKQALSTTQIAYQFFIWFDAFKQLKFIHYLTESFYPKKFYSMAKLNLLKQRLSSQTKTLAKTR